MSNPKAQDQIRYCERCGISFLWNSEAQTSSADIPHPDIVPNSDGQNEAAPNGKTQPSATPPRVIAHTPPTHCPGCRVLLPPRARERGLVKWYNRRKRFGFIVRRDHPEIFAHGADLEGTGSLRPGDLVEFSVAENDRGLAAKAITLLAHGDAPTPD